MSTASDQKFKWILCLLACCPVTQLVTCRGSQAQVTLYCAIGKGFLRVHADPPVQKSIWYTVLWASLVAQSVKNLSAVQETQIQSLGWEDLLEEEMATHPSILAWKILWTEEYSWLQSMESQKESDTT